eukprot:CAMPEP_0171890512 /NCGR_PEP_ID=MMETSP0992-20121227/44222_1 /TAXON_ID=483369 /ORGANISM="non described non described, Strain CCMP2098" /LENGTH=473 /DNA_ID=CAMNT_0012517739 /DNA_START=23 /DNA_END=1444 /DNA_ORIENTATION=-
MEDEAIEVTSLRCRFVTMVAGIRVTNDPFSVPARLGPKGLSDIINHLLGADKGALYDFLVYDSFGSGDERQVVTPVLMRQASKHLLRGSLRAHVSESERLLTIEYSPSLPRPSDGGRAELPDWVGCVDGVQEGGLFVSGCYDGHLRVSTGGASLLYDVGGHQGAVKAIKAGKGGLVVSGGQDQTIRTWRLETSGDEATLVPVGVGSNGGASRLSHENSVECVDVRDSGVILSGDWDGRLCVWPTSDEKDDQDDEGGGSSLSSAKKRKAAVSLAVKELVPVAAFKAHAQCVSGVAWMTAGNDSGGGICANAVTSSWDHSLKSWDIERQDCITTINGSKVNTCMDYSPSSGLVATGHPDGALRLWDLRVHVSAVTGAASTLASSSGGGWVSGVSWCVASPNLVASSSHDGSMRIYDARSSKPLFTLRAHGAKTSEDKGLCVAWSDSFVAGGGTDCRLKAFSFSGLKGANEGGQDR